MSPSVIKTDDYNGPDRRLASEDTYYDGKDRRSPRDWVSRHKWGLLTAWIVAFSLCIVGMYLLNKERALEGQQAKTALCAFTADLQRRTTAAEQYLRDIKDGSRDAIPGITTQDLQRSIDSQNSTLNALSVLHCPKVIVDITPGATNP